MSFDEFFNELTGRVPGVKVQTAPRQYQATERAPVFFSADVYTRAIDGFPFRWEVLVATFDYPAIVVGCFMTEDIYDAGMLPVGSAASLMIPEVMKRPTGTSIEGMLIKMDVASSFGVLCQPHLEHPQTRGHLLVERIRR